MKKIFTIFVAFFAVMVLQAKDLLVTDNVWKGWDGSVTVDGNKITFAGQWNGAGLSLGMDLSEYDYIEVVFNELTCNIKMCAESAEGGTSLAAEFASCLSGSSIVGVPLTKELSDYCDNITQIFLQCTSAGGGYCDLEGVYLCSEEEYLADKEAESKADQVIWEGNWVCENYAGNGDLAWGFDWGSVSVGTTLRIFVTYNPSNSGNSYVSLRHGQGWGKLPGDIYSKIPITESTEYVDALLTDVVIDDLVANGGLVISGNHYTLKKVVLTQAEPDSDANIYKLTLPGDSGVVSMPGANGPGWYSSSWLGMSNLDALYKTLVFEIESAAGNFALKVQGSVDGTSWGDEGFVEGTFNVGAVTNGAIIAVPTTGIHAHLGQFAFQNANIKGMNIHEDGSAELIYGDNTVIVKRIYLTPDEVTSNYPQIEPFIIWKESGYLYTMIDGKKLFLSRGGGWNARAIIADYGLPMEIITHEDNKTIIKYLDSQLCLCSYNETELRTTGKDNCELELIAVGDHGYKLKASNNIASGFIGVNSKNELIEDLSEFDALVWEVMSKEDYDSMMSERFDAMRTSVLSQAGVSEQEIKQSVLLPVKSSADTGTETIAEKYGNAFGMKWEYSVEPGLYVAKVNAFQRNGLPENLKLQLEEGFDDHLVFLSANGDSVKVKTIWSGSLPSAVSKGYSVSITLGAEKRYIPHDLTSAGCAMDNGYYANEVLALVGDDGKLTVQLSNPSRVDGQWFPYRDVNIFKVDVSLDAYKTQALAEIDKYEALNTTSDPTFTDAIAVARANINAATNKDEIDENLMNVRDAYNAYIYGISDWMNVTTIVRIENEDICSFLDEVRYDYLGAQAVVDQYANNVADRPRPITIPTKIRNNNVTLYISATADDYVNAHGYEGNAASGTLTCNYNATPGISYYKVVDNNGEIITCGQLVVQGMVRMIYTEGGSNIRDLGGKITTDGKRVRYGRIYRGSEMHAGTTTTFTSNDIAEMQRLGITAELDLRHESETHGNTASAIPGAAYQFMNMEGSGVEMVTDPHYQDLIRESIHFIAEQLKAGNVYFHCIWGADRTGALAMFLECILGCQLDDIEKDYQLTSFSKAGVRPGSYHRIDNKLTAIQDLGCEGNTIQEKVVWFLTNICKVSQTDIDYIRSEMLEESDAFSNSYLNTLKAAYLKVATASGVEWNSDAADIASLTSSFNKTMRSVTEVKDITSLVTNPDFETEGTSNWVACGSGVQIGGVDNHIVQINSSTGDVTKTLQNMPAGKYVIKVQGFNRKGNTSFAGYEEFIYGSALTTSYLKANGTHTLLRNVYEDAQNTSFGDDSNLARGVFVPENDISGDAAMYADEGRLYWNVAIVTLHEAGDLNIGVVAPENIADYTLFDNFRIYYCGDMGPQTLVLDESTPPNLPSEDTYFKVTSNRSLEGNKWHTLCIPFDMNAEDMAKAHITKARLLDKVEYTQDNINVSFKDVASLKAGLPYVVWVSEPWTVGSDGNSVLVRAKSPFCVYVNDNVHDDVMKGTYSPHNLDNEFYLIGNAFHFAQHNEKMNGFRAWLSLSDVDVLKAEQCHFLLEDIETCIEKNSETELSDFVSDGYNIIGQRVNKDYNGIVIKNGRKVIPMRR